MKRILIGRAVLFTLTAIVLTTAPGFAQEAGKPAKEEFSGAVVLTAAGPMTGRSTRLTMTIERWTTDEEKSALVKALREGGSDAFLKALRKMTAGYVRTTQSLRYQLNFASTFQTEMGRVVRLVTERPITFVEAMRPTRSEEYEFGVIELTLNEKGQGEGLVVPTAKVSFNKDGQLEVETLGTGPQKLIGVKKG